MSLKAQISNDMKTALLGGDRFVGEVLRNLKAAILAEEVNTGKRDDGLADTDIEKIILREVKKRKEATALYEQNSRPELADNEIKEAEILQRYLPEQLSEEAITREVAAVLAEMGDITPQQMGQVIGAVKGKLGTTADGSLVAKVVKEQLNK